MEKLILKDKFLRLLKQNPRIIFTLKNPDPKFLIYCETHSYKCRDYFPASFFTEGLLQEVLTTRNSRLLSKFPVKMLNELTEDQARQYFTSVNYDIKLIEQIPNTPYDVYLEMIKAGSHLRYDQVPGSFRTEELVTALMCNHYTYESVPKERLTEQMVDAAMEPNPDCLDKLPEQFRTKKRYLIALSKSCYFNLRNLIPSSECDQELISKLLERRVSNINLLPSHMVTKELCMDLVKKNCNNFTNLPEQFCKDEDIALLAITTGYIDKAYINSSLKTLEFMLKVAAKCRELGELEGVKNMTQACTFNDSDWEQIIAVYPPAIGCIKKENQTTNQINIFFDNASVPEVNLASVHINQKLIKKDHVPMMVGTANVDLQKIIQRKMTPQKRKPRTPKAGDSVPEVLVADDYNVLIEGNEVIFPELFGRKG